MLNETIALCLMYIGAITVIISLIYGLVRLFNFHEKIEDTILEVDLLKRQNLKNTILEVDLLIDELERQVQLLNKKVFKNAKR